MLPPDRTTLRQSQGSYIHLGRIAATPAAQAMTAAVVDLLGPYLTRKRPLGAAGRASLARDVGAILAGVMRPGLAGGPVRAQRSFSGPMWLHSALGRHRFWALTEAMQAAGLLGVVEGKQTPGALLDGAGGVATALWPTARLEEVGATHGVVAENRKADWRLDPKQCAAKGAQADDVVTVAPLDGLPTHMTPEMVDALGVVRANLQALNVLNAGADVRGAGHTVSLVRRFRHSLAFGGRFYGPSYLTVSEEERLEVTMGGEAVVEADVKASQLTVALGLVGQTELCGDPYAVEGIGRDAVKAWVVQSLGAGRPIRQWGEGTSPSVRSTAPRVVWDALRPRYAFLADLPALVPQDLLAGIPDDKRAKAAGQYVVQREADAVAWAMKSLVRAGVPVLPVHDALLVPASAQREAERSLEAAFVERVGIRPRLEVGRAAGP